MKKINKKVVELKWIVKKAWSMAYQGNNQFGGCAKDYLKESLKEAWKDARLSFDKKGLQLMGYVKIDGTMSYTIVSKYEVKNGKNGEYAQAVGLKGVRNYKNTFIKPFTTENILMLEKEGYKLSE